MASLKFFRDVISKITNKSIEDGAMTFSTDTNELFFDYKNSSNVDVRRAVKDMGAARQMVYSNSVLSLQDASGNTLSQATIAVDPGDFTNLFIGNDGHLYYEESPALSGVDFEISNHSNLILTIGDDDDD